MCFRTIGIAAGEQDKDVGSRREGAPRFCAIEKPPSVDLGRVRGETGHVRAKVGFRDGNGAEHVSTGESWQPGRLLLLRSTAKECSRHDLGPRDEWASDAERTPGE